MKTADGKPSLTDTVPCVTCGGVTVDRDGARYCDTCDHVEGECTCEPMPTRGVGGE